MKSLQIETSVNYKNFPFCVYPPQGEPTYYSKCCDLSQSFFRVLFQRCCPRRAKKVMDQLEGQFKIKFDHGSKPFLGMFLKISSQKKPSPLQQIEPGTPDSALGQKSHQGHVGDLSPMLSRDAYA